MANKWHLILVDGDGILKESEFPDYDSCIREGWIWSYDLVRRTGNKEIDDFESKKKYEIYPVADEYYEEFLKKYHKDMTIEEVKKNCREGWVVNPNIKVVNGILRGINKNDGQCPCQNDSEDKHCPCSNYRLHDKCCCTLYVKDEEWGKPLKVGDKCEYYSTIAGCEVEYDCVVDRVFDDGVTYFLKEVSYEGETECPNRAALFTDNPNHVRALSQEWSGKRYGGVRGIRNIRRK